jgi:putative drug exporter of the RND superfamily
MESQVNKRPMTVRVASWCATHPWRAVTGWALFVVACLALAIVLPTNEATGRDYRIGEAGQAEEITDDGGLTRQSVENVVITQDSGPLDLPAAEGAADDVTAGMRELQSVDQVDEPVLSEDGSALLVRVTIGGDERAANNHVQELRDVTAAAQADHPELVVEQTGIASIGLGIEEQRGADLIRAESIALPVTLVILTIVFGALVVAGVPVLLAISSIAAAVGLSSLVSYLVPDAGVGANIIVMLGMALGVDYALFYVKRVREERKRSGGSLGRVAMVEIAAATSGRAVVMAGFAMALSAACLYFAADVIFTSLATATILVVAVAVSGSLTVLPALLAVLGERVDRGRVPFLHRLRRRFATGNLWQALLRPAMRRPLVTLLASTLGMLLLAAPALNLRLSDPGNDTFSRDIPAVETYDQMVEHFPEERAMHVVALRTAQPGVAEEALDTLAAEVATHPEFSDGARPRVEVSDTGTVATLELAVGQEASSATAQEQLRLLREDLLPAVADDLDGAEYGVAGDTARNVDYVEHQAQTTPWVVALVLFTAFVIMAATFRSVVIGLLGMALNLLSTLAAFGALVAVFQYSWAENVLGFTADGFIGSRVPLFVFVILFGLSTDYQIFVVSRIQEAVRRGLPTREAVFDGITRSAGVITSAAVVMMSVFLSFVFVSLVEMKQMGFALALAVLLDAVIIRALILPAAMSLLGRASWWPANPAGPAKPAEATAVPRSPQHHSTTAGSA